MNLIDDATAMGSREGERVHALVNKEGGTSHDLAELCRATGTHNHLDVFTRKRTHTLRARVDHTGILRRRGEAKAPVTVNEGVENLPHSARHGMG